MRKLQGTGGGGGTRGSGLCAWEADALLPLSCLKFLQPFFHLGLGLKTWQAPPGSFSVADAIRGRKDLAVSGPVAFRESPFCSNRTLSAKGSFLEGSADARGFDSCSGWERET